RILPNAPRETRLGRSITRISSPRRPCATTTISTRTHDEFVFYPPCFKRGKDATMKLLNRLATLSVIASLSVASVAHAAPTDKPATDKPASEKYALAYKFKAGDALRYSIGHRASVRSTIEGTTQKAVTRSESVKVWKVMDVMPDGEIEFMHIVDSVRMTNQLPERAEMI